MHFEIPNFELVNSNINFMNMAVTVHRTVNVHLKHSTHLLLAVHVVFKMSNTQYKYGL